MDLPGQGEAGANELLKATWVARAKRNRCAKAQLPNRFARGGSPGSEDRSAPAQEGGPGEGQCVNRQTPEGQTQPARPPIQRARWLITPDENITQAEANLVWHQTRQACEGVFRSVGKQVLQGQLTQSQQPTTACDLEHAPPRVRPQTRRDLAFVLQGKISRPLETRRSAWPRSGPRISDQELS